VTQTRESVLERETMLQLGDWARLVEEDHPAAFRANEMLVVTRRIRQLVIRARALEVHLVHGAKALEKNHHAKHRRVVGQHSALEKGLRLNFLKGQRSRCLEQREHDATTAASDAQSTAAQKRQYTFDSEFVSRSFHWNKGNLDKVSHLHPMVAS